MKVAILVLGALLSSTLSATDNPEPVLGDFRIRDFRFASGKPFFSPNFAGTLFGSRQLLVLIPASAATKGHGTHSWPSIWSEHLQGFLAGLPAASGH